jgi:hypothetical protein
MEHLTSSAAYLTERTCAPYVTLLNSVFDLKRDSHFVFVLSVTLNDTRSVTFLESSNNGDGGVLCEVSTEFLYPMQLNLKAQGVKTFMTGSVK